MHRPSKSIVTPVSQTSTAPKNERQQVTTAYFTVLLPPGFEVKTQEENATAQDVAQIVATQPRSGGQQIAINVATVGKEGLQGVASYNLRVKTPETYTKVEFGGMPAGVPTFYSQTDNMYEITGFWVRAGLYASISVSGVPNDKQPINVAYAQTLDGWQWK